MAFRQPEELAAAREPSPDSWKPLLGPRARAGGPLASPQPEAVTGQERALPRCGFRKDTPALCVCAGYTRHPARESSFPRWPPTVYPESLSLRCIKASTHTYESSPEEVKIRYQWIQKPLWRV